MSTYPVKSTTFTKRGTRKCQLCGQQNGFRQKGCKNTNCLAYIKKPLPNKQCNIDPIELITFKDTNIYSVLVKERAPTNRNFVEITDTTLSKDDTLGSIISRNAICYIDTCKYDATELLSISCKHVKNSSICTNKAEEVKITKNVLYNMKITDEQRNSIWKLYSENELIVPPLQRINTSMFVVQCPKNIQFPAGRLHITITPDIECCMESVEKITSPSAINLNYYCSCKKLKIVLLKSSDNFENIQSNNVCEHALFLLAGFLSSTNLQIEFKKFMTALNFLWIRNDILEDNFLPTELLINLSSGMDLNEHNYSTNNIFQSDPHLISGYCNDNNISQNTIQLVDIPLTTFDDDINNDDVQLELSDCQIELMDQFNSLTNEIDMGNDIIELNCDTNILLSNNNRTILDLHENQDNDVNVKKSIILSSTNNMVKNHVNNNKSNQKKISSSAKINKKSIKLLKDPEISPTLEFDNWLAYVIERINSSIDFNTKNSKILLQFQIKEDFFTYFSNKFSIGLKKRLPNHTQLIKTGKYKGKVKTSYIFTTFLTVKRIFSNDIAEIKFERQFDEKSNGYFIPSELDNYEILIKNSNNNKKLKLIKPNTFTAYICLGNNKQYDNEKKSSKFIVEWIPNIFPSSNFGILLIQFTLGKKGNVI